MPWSTLQNRSILSRLLADLHQGRTARIWVAGGGAGGDAPDPQASALGLPCGQPQPPAATRHFLHIHWPLATIRSPLAIGLFALYAVLRYVERNPLRANLVERAKGWRWSSLSRYTKGDDKARQLLSAWPIPRPKNWAWRVNRAEGKKDLEAVRRSVQRGQPYGSEPWCERIVQNLGLESTLRPRGRPRKTAPEP